MRMQLLTALVLLSACAGEASIPPETAQRIKSEDGKFDSSAEAVFLDFEFSGEVVAGSSWNVEQTIEDQLLFTIGHLNGERALGRLDRLELTNVETTEVDGMTHISYDARFPVAWGKPQSIPTDYELIMPRDVSYTGQNDFTEKYKDDCVDWNAHDVDSGVMWYYYRPNAYACELADEDVVRFMASVSPSAIQTNGKYPEYDRVWSDEEFRVIAVFGKNEDGETDPSDVGIRAFNRFVRTMASELSDYEVVTSPEELPDAPGAENPDIVFEATLPDGKRVHVVVLLVDNVRTAGNEFNRRYEALTPTADLIVYNGHAGLGANIRALASKGDWVADQYAIVFMNGCDTYAYVDSALWEAHAAVNTDDPAGTKHLDIVMNAMPAFFSRIADDTMALVRGLLSYDDPKTYEKIFHDVDSSQIVLVSGEEDNTYQPGDIEPPPPPTSWDGLEEMGELTSAQEVRLETPVLDVGTYLFEMTGSGDADLYVRIGMEPTTSSYDCRPYRAGSDETCSIDLGAPAKVHVMVRGYSATSEFLLVGRAGP